MHESPATAQVRVEGLHFAYGGTAVFEDFALVADAQLILLEGPSGCGKTTLLKLLAGVLTPAAMRNLIRPTPARLILQDDALFSWLTVEGNLECVPGWSGFHACPPTALPLVSLVEPLSRARVYTLSFGQRRIVELFRVLCFATPLMCLDEPFNFLDRPKRIAVANVIETLAAQGICFVISSHYKEDFQHWDGLVYSFDGALPVRGLSRIP